MVPILQEGAKAFNLSRFEAKYKEQFKGARDVPSRGFLTWLIGFSEGDGSFVVSVRGCQFIITQSTGDVQILNYIAETLGFGSVIKQGDTTSRFIVQDKVGLSLIVALFNGNIVLPSKKESFKVFIEMYNKLVSKGRITLETVLFIGSTVRPTLEDNWLAGFTDA
jgi:hypothetical protein